MLLLPSFEYFLFSLEEKSPKCPVAILVYFIAVSLVQLSKHLHSSVGSVTMPQQCDNAPQCDKALQC